MPCLTKGLAILATLALVLLPIAAVAQTEVPPTGVVLLGLYVSDGVTWQTAGGVYLPPETVESLCTPLGAD